MHQEPSFLPQLGLVKNGEELPAALCSVLVVVQIAGAEQPWNQFSTMPEIL